MKVGLAVLFALTTVCAFAAEENPPTLAIGAEAPDFALPAVDGKTCHLRDFASDKVLVIVFTCDHCPTAQLYEGRIKQLAAEYRGRGVALVAIQPNDPMSVELNEMGYTDVGDSFVEMKIRAEYRHFNFPYLYDGKTQATARKYGPAATPHVFIFDRQRKLRYQGRVDDNSREELVKQHDARDAIEALLAEKPVAVPITPSFGCSTKWAFKEAGRSAEMVAIEKEPVKIESVDAGGLKALRTNSGGKVLLVDFWATNCSRCVQELPEFETTYRMYRNRAFELVTVCTDHPEEQKGVLAVLQRLHASSKNLLFDTTDQRELMAAFDPYWKAGVPYTALIGADGTMVYQHQGPTEPLHIRRLVLATIPDDDYIGIRAHWSSK
jgi:peroxiredoxin